MRAAGLLMTCAIACTGAGGENPGDPASREHQVLALLDCLLARECPRDPIPQAERDAVVHLAGPAWGGSFYEYDLAVVRCTLGQTLTDTGCVGSATTYAYCTSNTNNCSAPGTLTGASEWLGGDTSPLHAACAELNARNGGLGFGGIATWRVPGCVGGSATPSECELRQVFDYVAANPSAFPNIPTGTPGDFVWAATSQSAASAFYVRFASGGSTSFSNKTQGLRARCVSGGP